MASLPGTCVAQEVQAPWEFASRQADGGADPRTTVRQLLARQGDAVLSTLQRSGVSKLGEFEAEATLVYPAFKGEALLTLGSPLRDIDPEAVWTRSLRARLPPGEKQTGEGRSASVRGGERVGGGTVRPCCLCEVWA